MMAVIMMMMFKGNCWNWNVWYGGEIQLMMWKCKIEWGLCDAILSDHQHCIWSGWCDALSHHTIWNVKRIYNVACDQLVYKLVIRRDDAERWSFCFNSITGSSYNPIMNRSDQAVIVFFLNQPKQDKNLRWLWLYQFESEKKITCAGQCNISLIRFYCM